MIDYCLKIAKKCLAIILGKKRFYRIQKWRYSRIASSVLKAEGVEALSCFNEITERSDKEYWLYWGTLLGAYREHDFIETDDDIDIGMFKKDISLQFVEEMERNGFVYLHSISDKINEDIHIAFSYKGLKFDLYSFTEPNINNEIVGFTPGKPINGLVYPIIRTIHKFVGISEIQFKGIFVKVLSNEADVLKTLYGDTFMKPIPKFSAEYSKKQYGPNYYLVPIEENSASVVDLKDLNLNI